MSSSYESRFCISEILWIYSQPLILLARRTYTDLFMPEISLYFWQEKCRHLSGFLFAFRLHLVDLFDVHQRSVGGDKDIT